MLEGEEVEEDADFILGVLWQIIPETYDVNVLLHVTVLLQFIMKPAGKNIVANN